MTHREVRVTDSGEHVYADGHRYRPRSPEERTYAVRRPDDPGAVRWGGVWLAPLALLPDAERVMPTLTPWRLVRGPYKRRQQPPG